MALEENEEVLNSQRLSSFMSSDTLMLEESVTVEDKMPVDFKIKNN